MIAAEARLAHHVLEGNVGGIRHRGEQGAAEDAVRRVGGFEEDPEIGALHHVGLIALVEHGKARRHIGLEGELLQKPRAQRVDGLHLQSAGRLQRAREQFARRLSQLQAGVGDADIANRIIERGVVERDPMAERGEDALGHVGCGSLGEGDAEDLFRRYAG